MKEGHDGVNSEDFTFKAESIQADLRRIFTTSKAAHTSTLPKREKAMKQSGEAYYQVGELLVHFGWPQSMDAARWFRKARLNGVRNADPHLLLLRGIVDEHDGDDVAAAGYYNAAVNLGDIPAAHFHLATMFRDGRGVPVDERRAFELFESAAFGGLGAAQYELGKCYESGKGVATSLVDAARWYLAAGLKGNDEALYQAGLKLTHPHTSTLENRRKAKILFRNAARLGHKLGEVRYRWACVNES